MGAEKRACGERTAGRGSGKAFTVADQSNFSPDVLQYFTGMIRETCVTLLYALSGRGERGNPPPQGTCLHSAQAPCQMTLLADRVHSREMVDLLQPSHSHHPLLVHRCMFRHISFVTLGRLAFGVCHFATTKFGTACVRL